MEDKSAGLEPDSQDTEPDVKDENPDLQPAPVIEHDNSMQESSESPIEARSQEKPEDQQQPELTSKKVEEQNPNNGRQHLDRQTSLIDDVITPRPISTNTLSMSTKQPFKWGKYLKITGLVILVLAVLTIAWILVEGGKVVSSLSSYNVTQSSPAFSVKFYPNSTISQKSGHTYLIFVDSHADKTAIWIDTINSPLSYGNNPTFNYMLNGNSVTGSCNIGKTVCVSDVLVNGQYYQINIASQGTLRSADIMSILSSINIK